MINVLLNLNLYFIVNCPTNDHDKPLQSTLGQKIENDSQAQARTFDDVSLAGMAELSALRSDWDYIILSIREYT